MKQNDMSSGQYLLRDLMIVALSVIFAIFLVEYGVLQNVFAITEQVAVVGSFVAGLFFTSVFTIAPASIALAHLSENHSLLMVATFGALGAMIGDTIIFLFIRDTVSDDINYVLKKIKLQKWLSLFHLGFLRIFVPLIGALIIASPLPDELGIAMMGLSHTRTRILIPVAFAMNFLGILIIAGVASLLQGF